MTLLVAVDDRKPDRSVWWPMLTAALAAMAVFWPALQAGITPEDFGWLVASRQLESPWPLLSGNVFFVYFYRPVPLLLWWLSAQAFGANALAHNALDMGIHALNAALVARLAWRVSRRREAAWVAGLVFACLPCAVGTALWMSDRFDPVALCFGLGALLAFERALNSRSGVFALGILLLGALLSKETAYAIAGWLLLRMAWRVWRRRTWRVDLWLAVLLPIGAALLLRKLSGTSVDTSLPIADVPAAMLAGISAWWWRFPQALSGFFHQGGPVTISAIALSVAIVAVVMIALRNLLAEKKREAATLALCGAALIFATPWLQWPVTRLALGDIPGFDAPVNLRFYYLAAAGVALLLGACVAASRGLPRIASIGLTALVCAAGAVHGHFQSRLWTQDFSANGERHLQLSRDLAARDWPAGCRIVLDAPGFEDDFRTHVDIIAKAAAVRNASLMQCAVFAGIQVYTTIVDGRLCTPEAWPGLVISRTNDKPVIARLGTLCTLQFTAGPAADDANVLRFGVSSDGHLIPPPSHTESP
jgi:hypothetical protein